MAIFPVFGKNPDGARQQRIEQSPQYSEGAFRNQTPTEVTLKGTNLFKMLNEYRHRPPDTAPGRPIPSVITDLLTLPSGPPVIVWFGHSSYLIKVGNFHILVDPVFSGNAAPFTFFAKAFPGANVYGVKEMPPIDMLLLTHDHYDHLDYATVMGLVPTTRHIYTSLGVGSHLEYWGVPAEKITELDWGETACIDGRAAAIGQRTVIDGTGRGTRETITLTATPARHFSGRSFVRGRTLWSSFVLKIGGFSLFLGGDSGYERHFRAIGDQYGPFDIALLECGQYGKNWPYIHMLPEDTVKAATELRANYLLPVHWGKFTLALHAWDEPIRQVTAEAAKRGLPVTTPLIGEPVILGQVYPDKRWWE